MSLNIYQLAQLYYNSQTCLDDINISLCSLNTKMISRLHPGYILQGLYSRLLKSSLMVTLDYVLSRDLAVSTDKNDFSTRPKGDLAFLGKLLCRDKCSVSTWPLTIIVHCTWMALGIDLLNCLYFPWLTCSPLGKLECVCDYQEILWHCGNGQHKH